MWILIQAWILYSGKIKQKRSDGVSVLNWKNFIDILK